jgi:predicted N-acyltransferase
LNVKIHRSIAEVNEGRWDAIVGKDRIFCAYKYIEALEKSGMNEGRCYYVAVYDGDEIVAHACAYFISTELDVFAQGAVRKIINLVRRKRNNFFILRSLECGPPIALGSALSFKDGADRAEAMRLLCHGIEELAKELGIKFLLFRDFYDDEKELCGFLEERGYEKIHNLPKAEIKVRWKSFDEYLNSMRSNYRCKIVKGMDKCAKANISIRPLKNFSDSSRELKRLYDNVSHQAKEIKRESLPETFFQNLDKYLGERAVILAAMKDDRLIGFMLTLFNGKELIPALLGLDYDYNREYCIYFNLFYKTIELAIETGMDKIDMGITTLDPKKDMGSEIVALNMYMKHSNPLLNKIIPTLFDMITPPDTTGPRNVFKEGRADLKEGL